MRTALVATALAGFIGLALMDLAHGNPRVAVASFALALANGLLLTQ